MSKITIELSSEDVKDVIKEYIRKEFNLSSKVIDGAQLKWDVDHSIVITGDDTNYQIQAGKQGSTFLVGDE